MLFWNSRIILCYAIAGIPQCLITSIFSYTNIFLKLHYHQNQQPKTSIVIGLFFRLCSNSDSLNAEIVAYYSENRTTSRIWKVLLNRVYSPKGGIGGVLSMRMQVILDSRFACPGSAPIRDGKKGEFRDWTRISHVMSFLDVL